MTFAVRLSPGASAPIAALREAIWSVDPDQPVPSVERLMDWIDDSSGIRRLSSALSSALGTIALLEQFLWNVSASDPVAIGTAALVLLATAALASWLPAQRASRTDPLEVLRSD